MPERKIFIVVALVLLLNGESFAQEKIVEKFPKTSALFRGNDGEIKTKPWAVSYRIKSEIQLINPQVTPPLWLRMDGPAIPGVQQNGFANGYYDQPVSFFCIQEAKFEKATSIPLRLRLGSLAYTDYLEKKPNAQPPR